LATKTLPPPPHVPEPHRREMRMHCTKVRKGERTKQWPGKHGNGEGVTGIWPRPPTKRRKMGMDSHHCAREQRCELPPITSDGALHDGIKCNETAFGGGGRNWC
jgi:hypothetical protein